MVTRSFSIFFFNDTATSDIYTLSLHDALPIYFFARKVAVRLDAHEVPAPCVEDELVLICIHGAKHFWEKWRDRKSTRLNSSHRTISYAVFCLKKKTKPIHPPHKRE